MSDPIVDLLNTVAVLLGALAEVRAEYAPVLDGPWMDNTYPDRPQVCRCCGMRQTDGHLSVCPVLRRDHLLGRG